MRERKTGSFKIRLHLLIISAILSASSLQAYALEGKHLRSDKAVVVPSQLVKEIEQTYIARIRQADDKDIRTDLQIKMEIPRTPLGMNLYLTPQGGKSLEEEVYFKLPAGGAQIDLENYLSDSRGLFKLRVELSQEADDEEEIEEDIANLRVYFIPRHHRLVRGDEALGLGCGTYAEISSFFKSEILKNGLDLTTTHRGYFPVIVGTYILVVYRPEGLKLASLTITDSRFKNSLCPQKSNHSL